jgi:hypothetical protein
VKRRSEKSRRNFVKNVSFFLDSVTRENYTFVSCFIHVNAASMFDIDWERRQTQPGKASKQRQHTQGTRSSEFPEVFNIQCLKGVYACGERDFIEVD